MSVQIRVDVLGQENLILASRSTRVETTVLGPVTPVRDEAPNDGQLGSPENVDTSAYLWSNVPAGGT